MWLSSLSWKCMSVCLRSSRAETRGENRYSYIEIGISPHVKFNCERLCKARIADSSSRTTDSEWLKSCYITSVRENGNGIAVFTSLFGRRYSGGGFGWQPAGEAPMGHQSGGSVRKGLNGPIVAGCKTKANPSPLFKVWSGMRNWNVKLNPSSTNCICRYHIA